jgi:hypothetical protein
MGTTPTRCSWLGFARVLLASNRVQQIIRPHIPGGRHLGGIAFHKREKSPSRNTR